jgi:hypothetical protein
MESFALSDRRTAVSVEPREIMLMTRPEQLLAKARTIDEVKDIWDKAQAARVYATKAGLSKSIIVHASAIKVQAERRLGEMLGTLPLAKASPGNQYTAKLDRSQHATLLAATHKYFRVLRRQPTPRCRPDHKRPRSNSPRLTRSEYLIPKQKSRPRSDRRKAYLHVDYGILSIARIAANYPLSHAFWCTLVHKPRATPKKTTSALRHQVLVLPTETTLLKAGHYSRGDVPLGNSPLYQQILISSPLASRTKRRFWPKTQGKPARKPATSRRPTLDTPEAASGQNSLPQNTLSATATVSLAVSLSAELRRGKARRRRHADSDDILPADLQTPAVLQPQGGQP